MSGYICNKAISLSGKAYVPGDIIPDEAILSSRIRALTRSGHIVEAGGLDSLKEETSVSAQECATTAPISAHHDNPIEIPIHVQEGILAAIVSVKSVITAMDTIQLTEKEIGEVLKGIDDDDALMIMNALEHRKGVLKLIQERHKQLEGETGTEADE